MSLILIIVVCAILFSGGGGYYMHNRYHGDPNYGYYTGTGILGPIVLVLVVLWLIGGFGHMRF